MTDAEFARAQIQALENECKAMRETLRDRFAMAALTGLVAREEPFLAEQAYEIADQMLEARK
jgi:hypothetical protein